MCVWLLYNFPVYSVMSSTNSNSFTSSFPIQICFFFFFFGLKSGYNFQYYFEQKWQAWEFLFCSWSYRKCFGFSLLNMMLPVGLSYMTFIMLKCVSSIPTSLRVFNNKWKLNFFKSFFCIYWDENIIFVL